MTTTTQRETPMNKITVIGTTTFCGLPCVIVKMNGKQYAGVGATEQDALRLAKCAAAEDIAAVTA